MAWNEAVVTNAGISLYNEALSNNGMTIVRAAGGFTTVPSSSLMIQTNVTVPRLNLPVVSVTPVQVENSAITGRKVKIRIDNVGIEAGYTLKQVGIFAKLTGGNNEVLLAIIQDEQGAYIPSSSENPEFILELGFLLLFSNELKITAEIDPNILVTIKQMNEELAQKEPSRELVTQTEAEAGTATTIRSWTVQRVRQAILAVTGNFVSFVTQALTAAQQRIARTNIGFPTANSTLTDNTSGALVRSTGAEDIITAVTVTELATANTIPRRNENGIIQVGDATAAGHAMNRRAADARYIAKDIEVFSGSGHLVTLNSTFSVGLYMIYVAYGTRQLFFYYRHTSQTQLGAFPVPVFRDTLIVGGENGHALISFFISVNGSNRTIEIREGRSIRLAGSGITLSTLPNTDFSIVRVVRMGT